MADNLLLLAKLQRNFVNQLFTLINTHLRFAETSTQVCQWSGEPPAPFMDWKMSGLDTITPNNTAHEIQLMTSHRDGLPPFLKSWGPLAPSSAATDLYVITDQNGSQMTNNSKFHVLLLIN